MDDKDSVKESFLARLQDENLAVVKALLKDPQVMSAVLGSFCYTDLASDVQFGEKGSGLSVDILIYPCLSICFWNTCWYFDLTIPSLSLMICKYHL